MPSRTNKYGYVEKNDSDYLMDALRYIKKLYVVAPNDIVFALVVRNPNELRLMREKELEAANAGKVIQTDADPNLLSIRLNSQKLHAI
jgi:hypothetical protein